MTTADNVINILKERWANTDAHAWLTEVNNGTGARGGRQFADALVCSCWPSRGLWLAGIEVKVSRSDWLRELREPTKSAEIQEYCRYWWVAAPEGVVVKSEVPDAWGYVCVYPEKKRESSRYKVVKQAPKLDEKPPTMEFMASVLRNQAKAIRNAERRGYNSAIKEVEEKWNKIHELERKVDTLENRVELAERDEELLRKQVESFQSATGIGIGRWQQEKSIRLVKAASCIDAARINAREMEARAREALKKIQSLGEELKLAEECHE